MSVGTAALSAVMAARGAISSVDKDVLGIMAPANGSQEGAQLIRVLCRRHPFQGRVGHQTPGEPWLRDVLAKNKAEPSSGLTTSASSCPTPTTRAAFMN